MARQYMGAVQVCTREPKRDEAGRFTGEHNEKTHIRNIEVHAKTEKSARTMVEEVARQLWPNATSLAVIDAARIKRSGATVRNIPLDPDGELYIPPAPENKSDSKGKIIPFISKGKIVSVEVVDKPAAKPAKVSKNHSYGGWGSYSLGDDDHPLTANIILGLAKQGSVLQYDSNNVATYVTKEEDIK